jgi:hypothetical protein
MSMVFRVQDLAYLDMTVFCRSNDLIYGGVTGANIVHFPFIQSVLAYELDLKVGMFYHVVNNAHIYVDNPHTVNLARIETTNVDGMRQIPVDLDRVGVMYICNLIKHFPKFIKSIPNGGNYLNGVIIPMYNTFAAHKSRKQGLHVVNDIQDEIWHYAAKQWLSWREL